MKKTSFHPLWAAVRFIVVLGVIFSSTVVSVGAAQPQSTRSTEAVAVKPALVDANTQGPFMDPPVYPTVFNGDLRDLPQIAPGAPAPIPLRYVPGQEPKGSPPQIANWVDSVVQNEFGAGQMPGPIANFAGLDFAAFGSGWPPDTNGDVGPNHYIQTVNTSIGIYDKTTGVQLSALTFNAFFTGPAGSPCDTANQGDPVVLYDDSVDRWVITDFAWFN
jgi:hypothetical protein